MSGEQPISADRVLPFQLDRASLRGRVARLGPAQMAATNAVIQAWSVTFMAAAALAVTNTTLVGQCLGARRVEDARSAVRKVMNLGTGLTIIGGVFYFGFPEALMRLFVEGQDVAELLPYAKPLFGIPIPFRESSCSERNLSRERLMATDSLSGKAPVISYCLSTAVP